MLIEQRRETQRQAASLRARIEAERDAATLLDVELEANRLLVAQGYVNRVALSRLERQAAESRAREADREAELSSVRQRLGELDLRRAALDTERTSRAAAELATASASEADLADRSKAAEGVAGRLLVRAPVAGVVVANKVFTVGGVVAPGQALMEIVPEGERLIVEARVDTSQVDTLHPGQPAQLRLTGAGARYAPPLAGTLEQVSADRLADERDGVPYYIVRASVDAGSVQRSGIELRPGMPVELHLRLPDRTALRYLVEPLTRRLARTMREP
jgi:protease secretion system membrane fusion protein